MSHWFCNIISFGGRALPAPVAELGRSSWAVSAEAVTSSIGGSATTSQKHVHVSDRNGNFLGRVTLGNFAPLDDWQPPRKVVEVLRQLKTEGRL